MSLSYLNCVSAQSPMVFDDSAKGHQKRHEENVEKYGMIAALMNTGKPFDVYIVDDSPTSTLSLEELHERLKNFDI